MSTPKLQARRGLAIYPTDNALIPFPGSLKIDNIGTSISANQLVCATGNFIVNNVQVGDVVFNVNTSTYATVTQIISATTLQLNANIFTALNNFLLYGSPAANAACALYIGSGGTLHVLTDGDDFVAFAGIPAGTFLPVLVKQVYAGSSASNIVALW
jgi:hypothetical protein